MTPTPDFGASAASPSLLARSARALGALVWIGLLLVLLVPAPLHAQEDGAPLPPFPATESSPLELVAPDALEALPLAVDALPPLVINEIHYNPDLDTEWVEFIEIHNRAAEPANVGAWTLSGGINYVFPDGTVIPARGYLVVGEEPGALAAKFGVTALGPYTGRLSGDGERVVLRNQAAAEVDEVEYAPGFPWPTVGYAPGASIQLLNPGFDSAVAAHWRSATPTPGRANAVLVNNAPPQLLSVQHTPQQPRHDEIVTVTAVVNDSDGLTSVRLLYQAMAPGAYISLNDAAYQTTWTAIAMQPAGDGSFSAQLPAALSKHRTLVRYRIEAIDRGNRRVVAPYSDDPQPNFAFLVYHGVPHYYASLSGTDPVRTEFDFSTMRDLPVYLFVANGNEVADAFHMPPSAWESGYMGDDYFFRGTLVYNGIVYDHVRYRARGGFARYATGKNMWKINFNPGHRFQAYDNWGRPYPVLWDKLNLSTGLQQSHRNRRGEQGMFESMSYRLFQLANVPASSTHWAQLRVIDAQPEISGSQYTGDFWGLYLAVEQPDGFFLERNGLPDGNLYKMEYGSGELNNLGRSGPTDKSDLNDFLWAYQHANPSADWWRGTINLQNYFSYRAILEFTHHYDVDQLKNYIYYRNPETSRWYVLPWDVDLTWYDKMPGTGIEPFMTPVLSDPQFQILYQNRLRDLRGVLLNPEQLWPMLDEYASIIDTPAGGDSMVDVDRFMWDFNPIYATRYVDPERTEAGRFYTSTEAGSFRAMVEEMKRYAAERLQWIDTFLLTDHDHPGTPGISYSGAAGYPVDALRFVAGGFSDPQGAGTFGAMQWRIAEVTNAAAPAFNPAGPRLYEADAVWESEPIYSYTAQMTPPPGTVIPGHAYRVRVRMMDTSTRWGYWSAPIEFVAGQPQTPVSTALQISEIMYHALPEGNTPEDQLEYVEIYNAGSETVALDNVRVTGGIEFLFPAGARVAAGEFVLLVRDAAGFKKRYGFDADARYDGRLDNGGESLTLLDAFGRTLFYVDYGDEAPWPASADGDGYSLVYNPLAGGSENPAAWRASTAVHGSPGEVDPAPVRLNEVLLAPGDQRAVELYNAGSAPANVSHWYLSDVLGDPLKVRLPAGTVIPAGGYLVLNAGLLAASGPDGALAIDPTRFVTLYLNSANAEGRLTGYRESIGIPVTEPGVSVGRVVNSLGNARVTAQAQVTLGAANSEPRVGPIVISEIMYQPQTGPEYIELTNSSGAPVALWDGASADGWVLHGAYAFPAGLTLPPGGRVLITALPAHEACALYDNRGYTRIVGPLAEPLADNEQTVELLKPFALPGGAAFATVDAVAYVATAPWPTQAAGQGMALRRINLNAYGNEPANWAPGAPPPGSGAAATGASLCSLAAESEAAGMTIRWTLASAQGVTGFRVWRNSRPTRDGAVEVGGAVQDAGGAAPAAVEPNVPYSLLDTTPQDGTPRYYFVDAVTAVGALELGMTAPQVATHFAHLPVVRR